MRVARFALNLNLNHNLNLNPNCEQWEEIMIMIKIKIKSMSRSRGDQQSLRAVQLQYRILKMAMPEMIEIVPLERPVAAVITVPGPRA